MLSFANLSAWSSQRHRTLNFTGPFDMQLKLIATLKAALVIGVLACSSGAFAAKGAPGGGGGGTPTAPLTQIGGGYLGTVAAGAPAISILANMLLTQDLAGNLSGTICMQACNPLSGKVSASPFFPYGVFQFKAGDDQFSGIVQGPIICSDGTTGMWLSGSFQDRGATSTFSFTSCRQQ
jgi:hypothetical protein